MSEAEPSLYQPTNQQVHDAVVCCVCVCTRVWPDFACILVGRGADSHKMSIIYPATLEAAVHVLHVLLLILLQGGREGIK